MPPTPAAPHIKETKMSIVRDLKPADLDGLLRLYRQLNPSDPILPPQIAKARFETMLSNPGLSVLGAFVDKCLVAACVLHILPNLTRGSRSYALIENVVTDAAERRRGYGQKVVRTAVAAALVEGCYKVMIMTGRFDPGVQLFYESCGFKQSKKGFEIRG
jgi:GNAT superfamily N-acetyltransferase